MATAPSVGSPPGLGQAPAPARGGPDPSAHRAGRAVRQRANGRTLPHRMGRYTLFDHIGRGGMADIYLASARTGLGGKRLCVIKEVLPELAGSARFAELLVAEAKLAAKLGHANVVKVEDLGRHEGSLYIAMEYVEGFDLRELLRRCARDKVALPIEFSLLIVIETLRALDYAHRFRDDEGRPACVVHRDVSPSNVLISFDGEIKLCDFGIARANDEAPIAPDDTIQGKAGYMSPEHARGEVLDASADVFAAGVILWELLAGRRLYKAGPGEKLLDVARRCEIPPLPERGLFEEARLHAIVMRALAKEREDRYPSAAALLRDLEEYAAAAHLLASPLRFGEWLMKSFGRDIVEHRRGRERALSALERGPVMTLSPILPPPGVASAPRDDEPSVQSPPLPRGITKPGPIAMTDKPPDPPPQSRREPPDEPTPAPPGMDPAPPSLAAVTSDLAPAPETEPRRSRALPYAMLALAVLAALVWYLSTHP